MFWAYSFSTTLRGSRKCIWPDRFHSIDTRVVERVRTATTDHPRQTGNICCCPSTPFTIICKLCELISSIRSKDLKKRTCRRTQNFMQFISPTTAQEANTDVQWPLTFSPGVNWNVSPSSTKITLDTKYEQALTEIFLCHNNLHWRH